jgi:hypothetical protein
MVANVDNSWFNGVIFSVPTLTHVEMVKCEDYDHKAKDLSYLD